MLSRRGVFEVCAGCAASTMFAPAFSAAGSRVDACVRVRSSAPAGADVENKGERRSRSSGDNGIDSGMVAVLRTVLTVYGLEKAFAEKVFFYEDEAPGNAEVRRSRETGDVIELLLGRNLLRQTKQDNPLYYAAGYLGVLVHEFAHAYQIKSEIFNPLADADKTMKFVELHADFMAGWALPQMYFMRDKLNALVEPAKKIRALGDTRFGSRDHHGTPHQRFASIATGFVYGLEHPADPAAAAAYGRAHLLCLYDPEGGTSC